MKLKSTLTLACALALSPVAASADERPEIRFPRGGTDTVIEGGVVRGDRDIYPINARAGQTMTVTIEALEDNAVFQIFPPGTHYARDEYDMWTFHGQPVRGADGDTRQWTGTLTSGGQYLIVVGGTRGNASYSLRVEIR